MTQFRRLVSSARVLGSQLFNRFLNSNEPAAGKGNALRAAGTFPLPLPLPASEQSSDTHSADARSARPFWPTARPVGRMNYDSPSAARAQSQRAAGPTASSRGSRYDALPGQYATQSSERHGDPASDVIDYLPIAIMVADWGGRIVRVNASAIKLLGYSREELIETPLDILIPWRTTATNALNDIGDQSESVFRRKDGSEFPAEITVSAMSRDGAAGSLVSIVDRTERHELQRNRMQLAHLTRVSALGELAGSLAHELNQPLTAILSNAQAAQRFMGTDPIDLDEVREILCDLVDDNHRASDVLRKIRSLVQKGEFESAPLSIASVLDDVALLMHSDAVVRGIGLTVSVAADLSPVHGDRVQLQQVVINLLLNAFDAVESSPLRSRIVSAEAVSHGADEILIAVRDNGPGVAADTFDKLFMPYFTSKREGLGLGLSISRSIVEMHGGRIWAESNQQQGAAFFFTLPTRQEPNLAR